MRASVPVLSNMTGNSNTWSADGLLLRAMHFFPIVAITGSYVRAIIKQF